VTVRLTCVHELAGGMGFWSVCYQPTTQIGGSQLTNKGKYLSKLWSKLENSIKRDMGIFSRLNPLLAKKKDLRSPDQFGFLLAKLNSD